MQVLGKINRYLHRTGMSATKFGQLVANDRRLVFDLRRGRQAGSRMVARIEGFMAERQP